MKVHIHSDTPGWKTKVREFLQTSMDDDATFHAKAKDWVIGVPSVYELGMVFKRLKKKNGGGVEWMDFHTHGNKGTVAFGADLLTGSIARNFKKHYKLSRFAGQGFETIFVSGARVFFHGCNVADGADGELFLAEFASIFLKNGGGRVGASTSLGFSNPFNLSGKAIHLTGDVVYAQAHVGGDVSLQNHTYLHPDAIRAEIKAIRSVIAKSMKDRNAGKIKDLRVRDVLDVVSGNLDLASQRLGPEGSSPSYVRIYWAYEYMKDARDELWRYGQSRYWEPIDQRVGGGV